MVLSRCLPEMDCQKLTNRLIAGLPMTGKDVVVWDSVLSGFGLRVKPTGSKSFIVQYRAGSGRNAPSRRMTIGKVGLFSVDDARKIARGILADVAIGNDPATKRSEERADILMGELCDLYLAEGCLHKKNSTVLNDRSRIGRHIKPLLGHKRANAIQAADILAAHRGVALGKTACNTKTRKQGRAIVTGGAGAANQVVLLLSAIFNFGIKRGICTENPAKGIKKYKSRSCERFLSLEEIQRLGTVLDQAETVGLEWASKDVKHAPKGDNRRTVINPHAIAAIRLLMLTGCRLGEILTLEWRFVDMERGMLFLPDSKTGKKAVILGVGALAVLKALPHVGRYVIAGETPDKHKAGIAKPWQRVCEAAGLTDVRIHDLRHTFASVGAMAGLSLPMIGKLLGHSQTSTTARYAHLANAPIRQAADLISGEIGAALLRDKL